MDHVDPLGIQGWIDIVTDPVVCQSKSVIDWEK